MAENSNIESTSPAAHPDDLAVDRFAAAMKVKLAKKRSEGRGGWESPDCTAASLSELLREHVEKGDPLDVANFAMMLHQRGERIEPNPAAQDRAALIAATREAIDLLTERTQGSSARSPGHNARLVLENALATQPQADALEHNPAALTAPSWPAADDTTLPAIDETTGALIRKEGEA